MKINPTPQVASARPKGKTEMPPDVTVESDQANDSFHYNAPGYHREVGHTNPFKEGLTAGLVVGVPSAVGALEKSILGTGGSAALTLLLSPTAGALIGGVGLGAMAYRGTNHNPIYTGLAAIAGAGVGAAAWPLLKLPGALGGTTGAMVATGAVAAGAAVWSAMNNRAVDQEARDHGYKP